MDWWTIGYIVGGAVTGAVLALVCTSHLLYDCGYQEGKKEGFSDGWDGCHKAFVKSTKHKEDRLCREAALRGFGSYEINKSTGIVEWKWKETGELGSASTNQ